MTNIIGNLTPFITPALVEQAGLGLSWSSFPSTNATPQQRIAALMDVCWSATSAMELEANQELRATQNSEQEFGPDRIIAVPSNGWARFQLQRWPILQILSGQASPAGAVPPSYTTIPLGSMVTEHSLLPDMGTITPGSAAQGPSAILIAPGYVTWGLGRNGYLVNVTYLNGWPTAGIDEPCEAGDSTIHVDDITGWWNGTAGARGTIYDPPLRESITVLGATPDTIDAITGPGTLEITPLQFDHTPVVDATDQVDQNVLLSSMPRMMLQAGLYFATHFGLIRGAQAAVMQSARGQVVSSGVASAQDWYDRGVRVLGRFARAQI